MSEHLKEIAERLASIRDICGYEEEYVADRVGISVDEYKEYEKGQTDIPVSVLYALAHVYDINLTELLTGDKAKLNRYSLVKKGKGIGVERGNHYQYKSLAYSYANRQIEPLWVKVDYEEKKMIDCNSHEGHEFHYCLKGEYQMYLGDKILDIEEGDSLYFDSKLPHAMVATKPEGAEILVIVI